MNAGASVSQGDVLLFLHADTRLPDSTTELIRRVLEDFRVVGGNFCVRFEPRGAMADFYTCCYNVRSRARVFYGDSAIFVRREVFERLGGYRHTRLMEDLELVRRLRKAGRLRTIQEGEVVSSARRFTTVRSGLRALALWTWLHLLFYCGASQEALERRYPQVR
jgi:GT2 family glycosyltransferase